MRSNVFDAFLFWTLVTGAVAPSSAFGQSIAEPGTWTGTPFVSVGFGTSAPGGSVGIGGSVGYDFTPNIGIEGEVGHLFDVAGDTHTIDWSVTTFSANALYHFDVVRFTPYATFGVGAERSSVDVRDPDPLVLVIPSSTEVVWNFGGGAKYRITNQMIARADLRRFQANDSAPDFWRLYGGLTFWLRR